MIVHEESGRIELLTSDVLSLAADFLSRIGLGAVSLLAIFSTVAFSGAFLVEYRPMLMTAVQCI